MGGLNAEYSQAAKAFPGICSSTRALTFNKMKEQIIDEYCEELFTVSRAQDYLEIKQLLDSGDICVREKTETSSICCSEPKAWIENKTTFLVKKDDVKKAVALCDDVIEKIKNRENNKKFEGRTFFEKLSKIFRFK